MSMTYISTRGTAPALGFEDALLTGLATDGGLYMPAEWPSFSQEEISSWAGLSYADLAFKVISPFIGDEIAPADLKQMIANAYGNFDHEAVTPLTQLNAQEWVLELFHGPTFAFKDVAMQLLGPLFDHALKKRQKHITIIGATSGDTGSAAIEAMRGRDAVDIFILHPKGRTSDIQRRQMTTVADANVHNIAIEGTFDDCQALVKDMFNDPTFRDEVAMAGVNSINWARVMAQIVYYFHAALSLGGPLRPVAFSVPTGNFGDVLAGYAAARMGLPIERLIIATNINDILTRTLTTRRYEVTQVAPTMSPSMDIQVSSNFERLLFEAYDRDAEAICGLMNGLKQSGAFSVADSAMVHIEKVFRAARIDEAKTLATIAAVCEETGGITLDPHSAVGVAAARQERPDPSVPLVTLATAHPAKFPDAVAKATGKAPQLPKRLEAVLSLPEHYDVLPNEVSAVQAFIRQHARLS